MDIPYVPFLLGKWMDGSGVPLPPLLLSSPLRPSTADLKPRKKLSKEALRPFPILAGSCDTATPCRNEVDAVNLEFRRGLTADALLCTMTASRSRSRDRVRTWTLLHVPSSSVPMRLSGVPRTGILVIGVGAAVFFVCFAISLCLCFVYVLLRCGACLSLGQSMLYCVVRLECRRLVLEHGYSLHPIHNAPSPFELNLYFHFAIPAPNEESCSLTKKRETIRVRGTGVRSTRGSAQERRTRKKYMEAVWKKEGERREVWYIDNLLVVSPPNPGNRVM
jgi:hypothetical protein